MAWPIRLTLPRTASPHPELTVLDFWYCAARRVPGVPPRGAGNPIHFGASLAVIREMRSKRRALARQLTPQAEGANVIPHPRGSLLAFPQQDSTQEDRHSPFGGTPGVAERARGRADARRGRIRHL